MASTRYRRHRRVVGMASASVASLVVQAVSSFVLQVFAAASLGAAGYGRYAIVLGLLATLTAVQSGLRDSSIVLDRSGPNLRGSVLTAQYAAAVLAAVTALVVGLSSDLTSVEDAQLLAGMVAVWSLEEIGRRFLIRDQLFGALLINDLTYAAGAFGTLGVLYAANGDLRLSSFLWAMGIGALVSFSLSAVQLPAGTYDLRQLNVRGLRPVLAFAGWRSAQTGVRPLVVTLARVVIAGFTSAAVLGQLETARLVVQPIWVLISGLGPFLLSHFARSSDDGRRLVENLVPVTAVFVAVASFWSVAAVVLADFIQPLIVGDEYPVDRFTIAAWGCFYIAASVGFPIATLLVAQKEAFKVFAARATDGAMGLAAVALLAWGPGARWTPFGLATGALVGALILWRMGSSRIRTSPYAEPPQEQLVTV